MLDPKRVALWDAGTRSYPDTPPFHPDEPFPEYPFGPSAIGPHNPVYGAVRALLRALGMDAERYGTPEWNPLGDLVRPGNTVIVKPNFVISEHPMGQPGIDAAVVHGSVLRPIIDYVWVALRGQGRILVADSPIKEVDFGRIVGLTGIGAIQDFYRSRTPELDLLDFRDAYVQRNAAGIMVDHVPLPGDPTGYTPVDLGRNSMFEEVGPHLHRLRSTAVYYENVMGDFHNREHHIYSIPNTVLAADVLISVAKLKTHRKGGVTLSLKNAVGITNEKRALPHHRTGSPRQGGDAVSDNARPDAWIEDNFRDLVLSHPAGRLGMRLLGTPLKAARRIIKPVFAKFGPDQDAIVEGDWYGNDTVWRMALDLNQALFFADREGHLQEAPQRRYLSIIDGIIAGEGEGPLFPTPKPCGVLLGGAHPVLVDLAGIRTMGFAWERIPMVREALRRSWRLHPPTGPQGIVLVSNLASGRGVLESHEPLFRFEPSAGWKGHVEIQRASQRPAPVTGPG